MPRMPRPRAPNPRIPVAPHSQTHLVGRLIMPVASTPQPRCPGCGAPKTGLAMGPLVAGPANCCSKPLMSPHCREILRAFLSVAELPLRRAARADFFCVCMGVPIVSGSTGVIRGIEYCCVLIFIRCILDERFHLSSHRYDPEVSKHIDGNQNCRPVTKNWRNLT